MAPFNRLSAFILFALIVTDSKTLARPSPHRTNDLLPFFPGRHERDQNPEVFQNVSQIVRSRGFKAEDHHIVTYDGYILTLNRILPKNKANGRVALLQHGLLDSAHTWINNPNNQSLGFILAEEGYDVWMPNSRGNTYSQRHVYLKANDETFWDFSWDEMARYDLPACIKFILETSRASKVYYIGHSQGTEIFFAHMHAQPATQSKIAAMVALAPVAYLNKLESPIRYVAPFCHDIEGVVEWFGRGQFLPSNKLIKFLALSLCRKREVPGICSNIIYLLAGYDAKNTNNTRLPVYLSHTPAGTSVQNVLHYCQSVTSAKFQYYDYGAAKNLVHYGQATPPEYGLGNIRVPMAVFWGGNDWLASPPDVKHTMAELGDTVRFDKFLPSYNHLDFVWGMDAAERVYRPLLEFLRSH